MEKDQHTEAACGSEEHLFQQLETARISTIEDSQEMMIKNDHPVRKK